MTRLPLRLRARVRRLKRPPRGSPPGLIQAQPDAPRPSLRVMRYTEQSLDESRPASPDAPTPTHEAKVTWLNVDGLGDAAVIQRIGEAYTLHPLALEDTVNVHQRPKVEEYTDVLYLVVRMPRESSPGGALDTEQLSIFLGRSFVITFQEHEGDCLEPVRERIRRGQTRVRRSGPDFLAYAVIDAVLDAYFPLLEAFDDHLERLAEEAATKPSEQTIVRLQQVKHDLLTIRRAIWPLRDALTQLYRGEHELIRPETRPFIRDAADHAFQIMDLVETQREIAASLVDLYLSTINVRMGEAMRLLTIIATIFIPLTFVVGIYGMNFDPEASPWNMPELRWRFGYPVVMLAMAAIAVAMIVWFARMGWLPKRPPKRRRDQSPH
ncbi:MAG: magnesium and cobalt transport protein CorA [Leptolyngbya sp. PLA2]|nr:magnesium and cobalt transport protein CorA [Leptolyngbya sp.]MCE7971083.1 magnesium and cobalt transport protein CorA [Leptolyngbya sp. PL-A2]MCQ3940762.1 magnesium and cobalt transport protein CorA [cyanobacterium CYA1]MCZ7634220.1 magnesium/cobalt transporter CorA [Phycisphaerales bacterium]MDL1905077.1 magnesium/cobalt transporter CorA [Synechococcales cyanobacterium CNB]GIK19376.1 MAG: magnesium transport protein CorA [Planctomycetota bacterium]